LNGLAILDLLQPDLKRVEARMRTMSEDAFGPLSEAFLHLMGSGGKRLRPALALMGYRLFDPSVSDAAVALAAAVETLHTATLVHDDLIDGALLRRGQSTLNAIWNKSATVLAGDYLFARAAGFAAETENVRVVQLFAETLRIICDGELRQLFSSRQWQQAKEPYYNRIFAKTASLFASAARSGAILAGAPTRSEQALYDYGYHLGMAFQIVDDILDFTGDELVVGKPVGSDLRQGIVTLPMFHYLQGLAQPDSVLAQLEGNGVDQVVEQVRHSGAIQNARAEARHFADLAIADLAPLSAGECRQALSDLADFVVARDL
jgi:geranylgeranyl pyrophosphate synthase